MCQNGCSTEDSLRGRLRNAQAFSPFPFKVAYAAYGNDVVAAEAQLHEIHEDKQVQEGGGKEWYKIGLKSARTTLSRFKGLQMLSDTELEVLVGTKPKAQKPQPEANKKMARYAVPPFDSIGIHLDDELTMSNPQKTCRVVSLNPPEVELDGKRMTLSAAAYKTKGYRVAGSRV